MSSHEVMHFSPERRAETTKTIRETEAEAVAHVVCQALGRDTLEHPADYIQLYNGDADVLAKSMDHIQKTAAEILERDSRLCYVQRCSNRRGGVMNGTISRKENS